MTAMLRGRGCRTLLPVAPCCSSAAAAAAAADRLGVLAPPPLSSACVRLPDRLCPADARPCCTTGSSGGSSGCLVTCGRGTRQAARVAG